jgi:hypothetical protein
MTRKLEELLGLPRLDEKIKELEAQQAEIEAAEGEIEELAMEPFPTATAVPAHAPAPGSQTPMSLMELEATTVTPAQMAEHDRDMDDIADKAMETFEELKGLGFGVEAKSAGPIFEPMVQMLKLAMDAKGSKVGQKMKYMRLQLERDRLEHHKAQQPTGGFVEGEAQTGVLLDRNDLLASLGGPRKPPEENK